MERNVVSKWDSSSTKKFVTKWDGGCYKVGQPFCYKVGRKLLQSETGVKKWTEVVAKWDKCYKVEQKLLQSVTGVTKWDDCYKVGSNTLHRFLPTLSNRYPYRYFLTSKHDILGGCTCHTPDHKSSISRIVNYSIAHRSPFIMHLKAYSMWRALVEWLLADRGSNKHMLLTLFY